MPHLILKGLRQNNLKDIDLSLPLGESIIVTGPSGSGKSSLAFETIYAEGQRRYMQSMSTYARQFMEKFRAPLAEKIENIAPTIALEQINPVRNSRATVGTSTEIYDYLRLLFEKIGTVYCDTCHVPMESITQTEAAKRIAEKLRDQTVLVTALRKLKTGKASVDSQISVLLEAGYSRVVFDSKLYKTEELLGKKGLSNQSLYVVVDRVKLAEDAKESRTQRRLKEALGNAWEIGEKRADILVEKQGGFAPDGFFLLGIRCPSCGKEATPKTAASFSFNSPLGACAFCKGFGNTLEVDENLVIPDPRLSLAQGAIDPFTKPSLAHWQKKMLAHCKSKRIDVDLSYRELPTEHKKIIFEGDKGFKGVRGLFKILEQDKYKMRIRVFISRYVSPRECTHCRGARLNPQALSVKIAEKSIAQVCAMTIEACAGFLRNLNLSKKQTQISEDILQHLNRRLDYLTTVGVGYLTISRLTRSLSGGEYQRILLSTQLSQGLTDTLYVLDEPSIGLHPKDTGRLLDVLKKLLSLGNTLVIVEHDPEIILWGSYLVELGPGSGSRGGQVIFSGPKERYLASEQHRILSSWIADCQRSLQAKTEPIKTKYWLELKSASGNNLKNINADFPLKHLIAVTGVSGSGKSTLIVDTLYPTLAKLFGGQAEKIERFESISGFEHLDGIELVDQSPIGKSSRSNPITFVKGFDEIRSLFAHTRDASARGFLPGHFSFNVPGGRCEKCEGEGRIRIDMVFMEDIWIPCDACDEKRFKTSILKVKYRGKNIDDCLRMTIDEAFDFFKNSNPLRTKLGLLQEVGLGYLQLGQPGFTLSGGEAQRLKIARELGSLGSLKRRSSLFILDEPTTGLHFEEIFKLLAVLKKLIQAGHSVIVIEHNLQVICHADYVIDLGPDGGKDGGTVVDVGTPYQLAQRKRSHTGVYLAEILEGKIRH